MYNYNFTDEELKQIENLYLEFTSGRISPLDMRRYTKKVKNWAIAYSLICTGEEVVENYILAKKEDYKSNRYYVQHNSNFFWATKLPIEVLWSLVNPMIKIENGQGFSITTDKQWYKLNIYPNGEYGFTEESLERMSTILYELQRWGYITFQHAGKIWWISKLKD